MYAKIESEMIEMEKKYSNSNKKKYYPKKKRDYSKQGQGKKSHKGFEGFLGNNLVDDMKFGSKGQTVSGYVQREVEIRDSNGNVQVARETQFFNSGNGYKLNIGGCSNEDY